MIERAYGFYSNFLVIDLSLTFVQIRQYSNTVTSSRLMNSSVYERPTWFDRDAYVSRTDVPRGCIPCPMQLPFSSYVNVNTLVQRWIRTFRGWWSRDATLPTRKWRVMNTKPAVCVQTRNFMYRSSGMACFSVRSFDCTYPVFLDNATAVGFLVLRLAMSMETGI